MSKTYIGIDNGVSGTIAVLSGDSVLFQKTPVKKVQDYTKAKKMVSRLDAQEFYTLLSPYTENSFLLLERPLVNPTRFAATQSALRCHEAMLIVIELLRIPYGFIDSKEWQRAMLPKGTEGEELKRMSLEIANRKFPQYEGYKHPDRDALLIAEYAKRQGL